MSARAHLRVAPTGSTCWRARLDDYELGAPSGYGPTREHAIAELDQRLWEEEREPLGLARALLLMLAGAVCAPIFLGALWFVLWIVAGMPQ